MTQSMRNIYSGERWVQSTPTRLYKNEQYYMFPVALAVISLGAWLWFRKKKGAEQAATASAVPPTNGPSTVELGDGCRLVCDDGAEGEAPVDAVQTEDEWVLYGEVPQQESAEFVDELAAQGSYQQQTPAAPASPGLSQAGATTAPGQAGGNFGAGSVSQSSSTTSMVKRPLRRKL